MTFLHKRVGEGSGTFGSDLRDLRELHGVSIERASRDTKIRDTVLRAFEEDRILDLEDPVFSEHHLLAYVRYLGGHEPYFIARYQQRLKELNAKRNISDLLPRVRGVRWVDLFAGPQFFALLGILLLAALFGGYVLWQAHLVRTPPPLELLSPMDGERVKDPTVVVRGTTMPEANVTVNGRDAAVDSKGSFSLSLDVRRGTTMISVIARRRRGSETQLQRSVVYESSLSDEDVQGLSSTTSSATSTR